MTAGAIETQIRKEAASTWWLWLITGILWIIASLVVLQFDEVSAATVGIIAGILFMVAGAQYLFVGTLAEGWRWLWFLIGAFLILAGFVALIYPTRTFLAIANILGFILALVGIAWIIEAFVNRSYNDLWWLGLVSGIVMVVLGFWLGGQFLVTQAATLLIFVGIWAMVRGILDIVAAFSIKGLAD